MVHISNADFFGALDPSRSGVKGAVEAALRRDYGAAWRALAEHFARRRSPIAEALFAESAGDVNPKDARAKKILAAADKIVRHEITGWHSTTFKFGKEIDFNADFGQSGIYGFHYLGWLPPIGQAYLLTGEGKYAAAFDDVFSQWYDQRDRVEFRIPHLDPIWYELGCGARLPVLMRLYHVFRSAPEIRIKTVEKLWKTFLGHGRWLFEHESKGYRSGNWQVTGCRALLLVGVLFPEFKESSAWVELGKKRLMEHCERDFLDDGCYSERCPSYGTIGMRFLPELYDLLGYLRGSAADRDKLMRRMKGAYQWYMLTSTPIGTSPATGDSGYVGISALMKEGARRTGDGTLLWPVRDELSDDEKRALPEPARPPQTSVNLPSSGFAIMRSGWERDDLYMMVNYGPTGGWHTHNHALDFELFAYGQGLALDTSRFDSYDNPLDAYFRSARAHNQVVVNDADMDRQGLKVTDVVWQSDEHVDFFAGTHDGYAESHGVLVSRKVVFVKPHYWLVSDVVVETQRPHCYTWFLHSPHRFRRRVAKSFSCGKGPGLLVVPARADEIRHVRKGVGYTKKDWRAPGLFPDRYWIGYRKFSYHCSFATFAVLLFPFRKEAPSATLKPLSVRQNGVEVSRKEAEAFEVCTAGCRHAIVLSHSEAARRQYGPLETDCRMGVFQEGTAGWTAVALVQ